MEQRVKQQLGPFCLAQAAGLAISLSTPLWASSAQAQADSNTAPEPTWQHCAQLSDNKEARLSCFDQWAAQQRAGNSASYNAWVSTPDGALAASSAVPRPAPIPQPAAAEPAAPAVRPCQDTRYSELSRFWELEYGTDCGSFNIRGYRPISLSWISSDNVNAQPTTPSPDHTAATALPYDTHETRLQLSVRTKIAQGLLTHPQPNLRDSLWFGYTQQSYWQLFNGGLSRPFRSTDHEPEITYIYPTDAELPGGWRLRYSGVRLEHQSNGQSLPLSRSWNRTMLLAGMEKGDSLRVQGQLWNRLTESAADDDNPDISDYIGRAEVSGFWDVNQNNTLGITVRHALQTDTNGSIRLEWLKKVSDRGARGGRNGLRFHTQLFSGYGDTMVDYNRFRTVLSIGLSLVDW